MLPVFFIIPSNSSWQLAPSSFRAPYRRWTEAVCTNNYLVGDLLLQTLHLHASSLLHYLECPDGQIFHQRPLCKKASTSQTLRSRGACIIFADILILSGREGFPQGISPGNDFLNTWWSCNNPDNKSPAIFLRLLSLAKFLTLYSLCVLKSSKLIIVYQFKDVGVSISLKTFESTSLKNWKSLSV